MTDIKDADREAAGTLAASLFDGICDPGAIKSLWCAAFAVHREAAERAERDRVVAWLRGITGGVDPTLPKVLADAIERGSI